MPLDILLLSHQQALGCLLAFININVALDMFLMNNMYKPFPVFLSFFTKINVNTVLHCTDIPAETRNRGYTGANFSATWQSEREQHCKPGLDGCRAGDDFQRHGSV